jgi:hypothetical protein
MSRRAREAATDWRDEAAGRAEDVESTPAAEEGSPPAGYRWVYVVQSRRIEYDGYAYPPDDGVPVIAFTSHGRAVDHARREGLRLGQMFGVVAVAVPLEE